MIDMPEHITVLKSGTIVMATVRQGDEGDTVDLPSRGMETSEVLEKIGDDPEQQQILESLTADKGSFGVPPFHTPPSSLLTPSDQVGQASRPIIIRAD